MLQCLLLLQTYVSNCYRVQTSNPYNIALFWAAHSGRAVRHSASLRPFGQPPVGRLGSHPCCTSRSANRTASRCQSARSAPSVGRHLPCRAPAASPHGSNAPTTHCLQRRQPSRAGHASGPPKPARRPSTSTPLSRQSRAAAFQSPASCPHPDANQPHQRPRSPATKPRTTPRQAARPLQPVPAAPGPAVASIPYTPSATLRYVRSSLRLRLRSSLPTLARLRSLRSLHRRPAPLPTAQSGLLRRVFIGGSPPNPRPSCPG